MKRWMMTLLIGCTMMGTGCSDTVDEPGEGSTFVEEPGETNGGGDGPDYCAEFGWYGDGHCDDFCNEVDPDCEDGDDEPCPDGCNGGSTPDEPPPPEPDDPTEPSEPPEEPEPTEPVCEDTLEAEGTVHWVSEDPEECAAIRFTCADGQDQFFNDCGCGCIEEAGTMPVACLDDSVPGVERWGDTQECTLLDFVCPDGWNYFQDDCGCGCAVEACYTDSDCPNGYCAETACGTDAACPKGCFYPDCSEPAENVCAAEPPTCEPGETAAIRNGCWECVDARTCEPVAMDG